MAELDRPVGVAVIGAGAMGSQHAETLARRVHGAALRGIADPQPGVAERLAARLGCPTWTLDYRELVADPMVEALVIATPAPFHVDVIVAAASAGKAAFCEKPLANTLADADRALRATRVARVPLQVGFQRRFDRGYREAQALVAAGKLGRIQLLRSITRDPLLEDPSRPPPWAVFRETMIHDFDSLRFLAGGAEPIEVFAMADALVHPDWKSRGLLDTAVVSVRYDSGALGVAEASLQAVYGYDVRAEVLGSDGMATVGDAPPSSLRHFTPGGVVERRAAWFVELFGDAYARELAHFVECVRSGATPACSGEDGRAALLMALAAIRSVELGRPVRVDEVDTDTSHSAA